MLPLYIGMDIGMLPDPIMYWDTHKDVPIVYWDTHRDAPISYWDAYRDTPRPHYVLGYP